MGKFVLLITISMFWNKAYYTVDSQEIVEIE